jgi:hypothetical protein
MTRLTLILALLITLSGCKTARVNGIDDAAKGTQRLHQRFDSISDAAAQALPDSGAAKPLVAFIGQQATAGKTDVKAVDASLTEAAKQATEFQAKYDKLAGNRWVRAALWVQRTFWTAVIGLVVLNIFVAASPFLGGWAVGLGKNIVRLGSFSGPGAFAREAVLRAKGAKL